MILKELEPASKVVNNNWQVICVLRRASLLQAGSTSLGRECQRWPTRAHIANLSDLKINNCVEVLRNLDIPFKEGHREAVCESKKSIYFAVKQMHCQSHFLY